MALESVNPATGEVFKTYEAMPPNQVSEIIGQVQEAWLSWRTVSIPDRAAPMKRAASILRARADELARLMAVEMGKPLAAGRAEAEKCAWVCEYYAENAQAMLAEEMIETDAARSYVVFEPLGAVLAVMPWNFPFWQVFRFIAPALMAGNAGLLKHASSVCGSALAIEEILREAGFPPNLFRSLLINAPQVEAVIEHPHVKAVTLTGSGAAGRAVAAKAGACLKKTVLELGGSDPYLVLEDADLEEAASICAASRLINTGQSCIAAKRFIVVEPVRERFEALFVERLKAARLGDPLEEGIEVGPLARRDLRDEVHKQVRDSVARGARLLLGGEIPAGPGAFYPPTALSDVAPGMPAYDEEIFGPVAAIIPVKDEKQAVAVANDSPFGLGAAVFSRDVERAERLAARQLRAGSCFVNALVKSDPRLPFGGIGESGYGRELGVYGIKEFVNIKTIYVR